MDVLDKIQEMTGLKFEDLNALEKETAIKWVETLSTREITLSDIKEFIASMKNAVDNELATSDVSDDRDLFLKARLKNLLMLQAFLETPEKANKALESYLGKMKLDKK